MTLQHRALPLLASSVHSRCFLSRTCAYTGFRRMATESGVNAVSAIYHRSPLHALNTLAIVPEKNTVI